MSHKIEQRSAMNSSLPMKNSLPIRDVGGVFRDSSKRQTQNELVY